MVTPLDADTDKLNCVLETTKDFAQSGTKVSILGAIPGVEELPTETYPELADFEVEYKQKAVARLREAACEHGLFASTQVELGDASQLAAMTANQLESQLIVVENDRCRDMMSSTAQHVMALAEMDVLFVNTDS